MKKLTVHESLTVGGWGRTKEDAIADWFSKLPDLTGKVVSYQRGPEVASNEDFSQDIQWRVFSKFSIIGETQDAIRRTSESR